MQSTCFEPVGSLAVFEKHLMNLKRAARARQNEAKILLLVARARRVFGLEGS